MKTTAIGACGNDKKVEVCIRSLKELNVETYLIKKYPQVKTRSIYISFIDDSFISKRKCPICEKKEWYAESLIERKYVLDNLDKNDILIFASINETKELLLDMFKSLISDQYNSKEERILRHSLYLLLSTNFLNFKNMKNLILDLEYRNSLINQIKDEISTTIIDFFTTDFNELKTKSYSEAISSLISFIDEMEIISIFKSNNNLYDISRTVEKNFLTLFSLNRTKLGDKATKTISGLIMQQILLLVQKKRIDEYIVFIIDEVINY